MGAPGHERMYTDLAEWWPLLSPPGDYAGEAAVHARLIERTAAAPPRTVLELGSGGGNVASHLKARFTLTLVDRSEAMLAVSRHLNPECGHVAGDMRELRLGRRFDAVLIHDAIVYMTTRADLRRAFETAAAHLPPGGVLVAAPDYVRETFRPGACHGGADAADGSGRGIRYLQWTTDPDPSDENYAMDFAYLMRGAEGGVHVAGDHHVAGLFPRAAWLSLLAEAGFAPRIVANPAAPGPAGLEIFVATRR